MKYLKKFKMYESGQDVEIVLQDIRDILQEFTDQGLEVTAMKNKGISKMMRFTGWALGSGLFPDVFVSVKSRPLQPQTWSFYSDSIHHLVNYMKDSGYVICDLSLTRFYSGSFLPEPIFKDKKPATPHIKIDPILYCEREFSNTPVRSIEISFCKV